nr:hypothetical protein [Brevundimonas sp. S30B]
MAVQGEETIADALEHSGSLVLQFDQARDVSRRDEARRPALMAELVGNDIHEDHPALAGQMPPHARSVEHLGVPCTLALRWVELRQRHVEELVARPAIFALGRCIDVQELQRFRIVDPHRIGVGVEEGLAEIGLVQGVFHRSPRSSTLTGSLAETTP